MSNTVEYYLSKGFDRKAAEYFSKGRRRIVSVIANDDFTLTITFDNNEVRLYDMRQHIIKGTVFEIFSDIDNFRRVYVDEKHCISLYINPAIDGKRVFGNKIDLCPDTCYMDSTVIQ